MPTIARVRGSRITMYQSGKEHNPPHVHVIYNEFECSVNIRDLEKMTGNIPANILAAVLDFIQAHQRELLLMWDSGNPYAIE